MSREFLKSLEDREAQHQNKAGADKEAGEDNQGKAGQGRNTGTN
jgi:hypothetical protein